MATLTLTANTPALDTSEGTANKRRRVVMPDGCPWLRIYAASDCYLELLDVADGGDKGTSFRTIPAGTKEPTWVGRGECAVSCAGSSVDIEYEALRRQVWGR